MPLLRLTKHHGLGNDFLVLADMDDRSRLSDDDIRWLCDRHRGVGADGVIRITRGTGGSDLSMELRNADSSSAEMSGNGIRCMARAAIEAGLVTGPEIVVSTGAGPRRVTVLPSAAGGAWDVRVAMGKIVVGEEVAPAAAGGRRARPVDAGNPHLVVLASDLGSIDVEGLGTSLSVAYRGSNVEFVDLRCGGLVIRTWERGAGQTLACGTGSVAAACAARAWKLVGERVTVDNPGGRLVVDMSTDEPVLQGPVRRVAGVEVELR